MRAIIVVCLINLFLCGCKKQAGEGGTSRITGRMWVEDWNVPFTVKNGEYAGADEDVYIIYGDDLSYGEKSTTSYEGHYDFKNLRKGKYKVYIYSKDKTFESPSGEVAIIKDVEIKKNKETVAVETFTILD